MEISQIKQSLTLEQVLKKYNLQPNQNKMLICPFHENKTASLQVNYEQNKYKCHACGKKGDQIQFVEDFEKITKHEALKKCANLAGENEKLKVNNEKLTVPSTKNHQPTTFLQKMFSSFRKGIFNSIPAKDYCKSRSLNYEKLEIGYNGGQFHHGTRKDEELIKNCLEVGLLLDKGQTAKTGDKAYSVFGKWCLVFPLKNCHGQPVSLYFRSVVPPSGAEGAKHFYLKNRQGIYPNYPNPNTKKLILTESIIDGASLLQIINITENYSLIACFGTNGLNDEILKAIKELKELEEIIFFFDNDNAGKEAINKYANVLISELTNVKISVLTPINKDINETLQLHSEEIFIELLEKRLPVIARNEAISPEEKIIEEKNTENPTTKNHQPTTNLEKISQLLSKSGIIGEANSSQLLFLIAISYKNKNPLHGIVQGSSGSGKTHIISRIADLMPQEDVLRFTRITESSLYNWGEFDLFQKIIIIEDLDGLKEDAIYALREFISNQVLRSSVTIKDKKGNNKSSHKIVKGQFSSLSATTKGETYEDNMSRSFLIAVDESKEQTAKIIDYQNKRNAGEIDPQESQKTINFIQQIIRNLKVYEVINPYATQLHLPEKVHKIRRLNEMYQAVIKQVTFLNQYQRKLTTPSPSGRAGEGFLITEIEDIEQATEILFESIVLKVDELDGSLRQFFERLKKYVKNENQDFLQREIRQEFNLSKTQLQRYFLALLELEYMKQTGGFANKGIKYKISYWDNHQKLRTEIKDFLMQQI